MPRRLTLRGPPIVDMRLAADITAILPAVMDSIAAGRTADPFRFDMSLKLHGDDGSGHAGTLRYPICAGATH